MTLSIDGRVKGMRDFSDYDDSGGIQCPHPQCGRVWQDFMIEDMDHTCKCGEWLGEDEE